ncbi:MAG: 4-demethylwyosine synthase TYW1 [Candidatus Woesearchaeota archaeon]
MLPQEAVEELEKQQYRVVGENKHSSVKVCGWTKNSLTGKGTCYKHRFYGIRSHQCLQMSTAMSCANRCVFCWRGYKAPVSKEWPCGVDEPDDIIEESIEAHKDLLTGYGGHHDKDEKLFAEAQTPRHVALSLTGEPITYPKINEIIRKFHERGISTFMVTNAQYPDEIAALEPVTQLYLSIDAPTEELLKRVDAPLFQDYWERMLRSLDTLKEKEGRTTIRLTMIKGWNMTLPERYAELIRRGDPDFVEVKAYMFVGASRQRLSMENMPYHADVKAFADEVVKHLPGYSVADEHEPSRVVLLAKDEFYDDEWKTWIDFDAFFKAWERHEQDGAPVRKEDCTTRRTHRKE